MHKPSSKNVTKRELRISSVPQKFEIRKDAKTGARTISGYFAVFDSLSSDLGGFVERIKPGAFKQSLKDTPDVIAYYNHNTDQILARVSNGSMTVEEDSKGLRFRLTLPPTTYADDLIALMEQNLVSACSFGFSTVEDDWQMIGDQLVRTLIRVNLFEGSIVGSPAYPATVADLRSCPSKLRSKLKNDDLDDDDDDADSDDDDADRECNCRCEACRAAHPNNAGDQSKRAANKHLLSLRRL